MNRKVHGMPPTIYFEIFSKSRSAGRFSGSTIFHPASPSPFFGDTLTSLSWESKGMRVCVKYLLSFVRPRWSSRGSRCSAGEGEEFLFPFSSAFYTRPPKKTSLHTELWMPDFKAWYPGTLAHT